VVLDGLDSLMDIVLHLHLPPLPHQPFTPFQHRRPRTNLALLVIDSSSASYPLYNGKQTNLVVHIEEVGGSILAALLSPWPISP